MKLKRRFVIVIFMCVLIIIFLSSCTKDIDLPLGEGLLINVLINGINQRDGSADYSLLLKYKKSKSI